VNLQKKITAGIGASLKAADEKIAPKRSVKFAEETPKEEEKPPQKSDA
jgi:hypothetical protein